MLWVTVWTLLVLGTLLGAFFLGRHLYRSGRALIAELGVAGERLGALAERIAVLEDAEPEHPVRPARIDDLAAARSRWDEAGAVRAARRLRRRLRYQRTYERWRSFSR